MNPFPPPLLLLVLRSLEWWVCAMAESRPPNILIISVDDMNDWFGCMEDSQAKPPHIDALASQRQTAPTLARSI